MRITRADGLITVKQVALLSGVKEEAVRHWISRGYWSDVLRDIRHKASGACEGRCECGRTKLPVAKREGRLILLEPREAQKAERATAERARRLIVPTPGADAEEAA